MFCKCGAPVCGARCCRTEQDPKTCNGVWEGKEGMRGFLKTLRRADSLE